MKTMKKVMLSVFFLLTLFVSVSFTVGAVDMIPIPKWGGGYITYRNSGGVQIKMPAEYIEPDSNFRAVWVSNVVNDIATYTNESQYKNEMNRVFDTMEYYNMNAIVFHVRTHHDAMYKSELNRLSPNYNGVNFDVFDPLEWIIAESKRRGIEFHAWMNPYRIGAGTIEQVASRFPAANPASDPNNLLKGNQNVILDPGSPEVRDFLVDTVMELVNNYDVDAIHFDDYFYESGVDDTRTRNLYNTNNLSIGDFRRLQVDTFIEELSNSIDNYNLINNKAVQLGISPSGIYRNGGYVPVENYEWNLDGSLKYPLYSSSQGFAHYDNYLYADTLKWINNEWIDYIVPQVYWSFDHPQAPHGDIVTWWNAAVKNKNVNLYIGTALYTAGAASSNGWTHDPREFANEVQFASGLSNVHGQVIFSYSQLLDSLSPTKGIYYDNMNNVKNEMWYKDALLPEIRTMDPVYLGAVKNLELSKTSAGYRIDFDGMNAAKTYAIYRSTSPLTYDVSELIQVIGKKEVNGKISYIDEVDTNKQYYYGVKALSKTNTPGVAASKSTESAKQGELLPVGNFPELLISDNTFFNTNINISWDTITPNFGGTLEYSLYTSTDGVTFSKNPKTITKTSNTFSTEVNTGTSEKLYLYLNAKNNVSNQNSDTYVIDVTNNIGPITNFTVSGDLYAGGNVNFIWNKLDVEEEVTYVVQSSSDNVFWNNLPGNVVNEFTNMRLSYMLPKEYSNNYYRVVATTENGKAISNSIRVSSFEKIHGLELKYNGKPIDGPIYINGDESIELTWNNLYHKSGNVLYRANITYDFENWNIASFYDQKNVLRINPDQVSQVVYGGIEYYVLYVEIEAFTPTARATSEIVEVRISPSIILPRMFLNNYYYQHRAMINRTGIFK